MVAKSNGITHAESLHEGLPELKFEWLPEKMASMAKTLSESQQVQPAMAIMACIATASACVVGKYRISDITANWTEEWSSLYTVLIAPSGGRKSSVFKKVIKPIEDERMVDHGEVGRVGHDHLLMDRATRLCCSSCSRSRQAPASRSPR
jgi:hypothetical protein